MQKVCIFIILQLYTYFFQSEVIDHDHKKKILQYITQYVYILMNKFMLFSEQILNGLACSCELGCMNTVYEVEKLQDAQYDLVFDSK